MTRLEYETLQVRFSRKLRLERVYNAKRDEGYNEGVLSCKSILKEIFEREQAPSGLTYGDIWSLFQAKYPTLTVDDWRPWGANSIIVWVRANDETEDVMLCGRRLKRAKNIIALLFEYDKVSDSFTFKGAAPAMTQTGVVIRGGRERGVKLMVEEITGDLLTCDANILCHQVNYHGVMGAGIALAIKNKLLSPAQYLLYQHFCRSNGEDALGKVLWSRIGGGIATQRYVANCFCQNGWSRTKCVTNYDMMEKCFANIEQFARTNNFSAAIPGNMGCGIAGGDWVKVRLIIDKYFGQSPVKTTVVYLQN